MLYERNGGKGTRLYQVWASMKSRCLNQNHNAYSNYGGRGITVCDLWVDSFSDFRDWAYSAGYTVGLLIDRIENNNGYYPDNCRWVTHSASQNNKRNNVIVTAFGETKTITEWSRDPRYTGTLNSLRKRVAAGWSPERALTQRPLR